MRLQGIPADEHLRPGDPALSSFSGIYDAAVMELLMAVAEMLLPVRRMDAQVASMPG
jgi:hypothetical protein